MAISRERLDSWKEIADYLARDRTTVMRWERTAGLPVHRVHGGRGRSVFAYKDDIDQWLARQPAQPDEAMPEAAPDETQQLAARSSRRLALIATAAGVFIVLFSLVVSQARSSRIPASVSVRGNELVAVDAEGRDVWRVRLPQVDGAIVPARIVLADVDGDGATDVLAALHLMTHGRNDQGIVMLVESRGRVRWTRWLDDSYRFGNVEYGPAWFPVDMVVYDSGGERRIAVAYHHHTWWPGLVVTYDARGNPVARFVNAGWVMKLNISADSRHLLAAGISNNLGGAALAVLDAAKPEGMSPHEGGSLPACANCPGGSPVSYFVTPWTELARPSDTPPVTVFVTPSGMIEWRAVQRAVPGGNWPEVIVALSPALQVVNASVNDLFVEMSPDAWRYRPLVRHWSPSTGWRQF